MQISLLDSTLTLQYNEFLNRCDCAMMYYSLSFKRLLEETLKCKSYYLIATDKDRVYGILPLMIKEGKYGEVLNSLPFYGSNGGILASQMEAKDRLLEAYNQYSRDFASATYITNPFLDNTISQALPYDFMDSRIGQITPLLKEEMLFKSFAPSARRNIAKALRSGVDVKLSNDFEFLYQTHFENITSINGIPKQKHFFENIPKFCEREEYKLYVAELQGKAIAALLCFYYGNVVEYYTPALLSEYRTFQALPLIIFKAMNDAYDKGYKWWNFGGTWVSLDGVYKFKSKFGAQDKSYYYYILLNEKDILNATKEELLAEYPYFYVLPFKYLTNG
ncbi:peptidoglycan bridge formation glycyltransferase FemA/FemB family protein [Helicobacter sp. MIT 11-5569]|uniref:peptidoglycan bridge formation glycyltransferase FemA/FemB family protein n=1 Tax=Helicobacter sp. MIT 11-5569 TaxID=1548151 RepID=UPI00051F8735|nr:peptidoglycan bridge formation glycyltransferase FemA/FemB family protein [Helicobacter sp. MIT 11-5569]TLD84592.1 peptidoglycan bridge formation glycyltransferase FemA/FemB family protein [Helicobacter sp. MIT 11-5569]